MGVNRENVVWQSEDGTWNRAFWDFYPVNQDDEDWDYEWDVEYTDEFNWVSTGHTTLEAALASWTGSNPYGHDEVAYTPETAARCTRLDAKARAFLEQERGRRRY